MAEYVHHWPPGSYTSQASATITGGQLLMVTGVNTVGPTTGATTAWVGVAAHDAVSGDKITVLPIQGVHRLTASGTVTAGDQVVSAAAGKVASLAAAAGAAAGDINSARQVVGTALTTATDGNLVDVKGR